MHICGPHAKSTRPEVFGMSCKVRYMVLIHTDMKKCHRLILCVSHNRLNMLL